MTTALVLIALVAVLVEVGLSVIHRIDQANFDQFLAELRDFQQTNRKVAR